MSLLYGYDPPLDTETKLRCPNLFCSEGGEWWHPEIALIVQRDDAPDLTVYVKDARSCAACGEAGEEIA